MNQRFQPYAPGGTVFWTTYAYDDLGRTTSVTQPGNTGTTTYAYQGNTVTVTDPKGAWKKYTVDMLGNLTQVTEPDPTLGNVQTNYTYNLRKQLIGVSMPRGGTTQTRTFNYDLATGRLTSVTNPETGTTSYTYNADGSVATRTDARSQHVEYTYDSLGRATQIRRYNSSGVEQTCQRMNYGYDSGSYGWGRLTSASWGGSSCTGGSWSQSFSYNAPGAVIYKSQNGGGRNDHAHYTYNSEGRLLSTEYPDSGPTFTYTYDSMGRPVKLTDNRSTPLDWVKDVVYNVAGQITAMSSVNNLNDPDYPEYTNEHRTYNVLGQVTHMHSAYQQTLLNKTYTYSSTQNDGRIESMVDAVSGETVQYQYDSLKRLTSAETTGTQWGQSFSYDGFGNLLAQTVTKGSAPPLSVLVSGTTNRITSSGYAYDSNGNLTAMPGVTMSYDVENRMSSATHSANGTEYYVYGPSNERVWKRIEYPGGTSANFVYFYGVDGALLTTNAIDDDWDYNVYFAGRKVWAEGVDGASQRSPEPVSPDRLGSMVKHFPYGDEPTTTTPNRTKFATYYRDVTTLDYARNRYYSSTIARFTTADPSMPFDPSNPQSFNLYAYVRGDPVNWNDPEGLDITIPIGYGQYECTSRVYEEIFATSGFGMSLGAFSNFARSDWGRMALAIWGEVRPGAANDVATNAAMMGVAFTFINRYSLRGTIGDFGAASATLGEVVNKASDIWNSDGTMFAPAYAGLETVIKGKARTGDCDGLIQAIKIAAAVMAQTIGIGNAGFGAMPYVYNPVGDALYFNSNGYALWTHPYGYVSDAGAILEWTGWDGKTKRFYFWGITPVAGSGRRPVKPTSPLIPYIPSPIDPGGYGRWGRGPIPL